MKILFIVYELGKTYSPTTKIAYTLARRWMENGAECHALGSLLPADCLSVPAGMVAHPFGFDDDARYDANLAAKFAAAGGKPFAFLRKCGHLAARPGAAFRMVFGKALRPLFSGMRRAYARHIKRLCEEERFDAVIGVYFPVAILQALGDVNLSPPVFLYQMDPWGLHESSYPESARRRMRQEARAFKKAAHIFTTPPLFKAYAASPLRRFCGKMTALEFPNITDAGLLCGQAEQVGFPAGWPLFLFTGSIADDYRSPAFFFLVLDELVRRLPNARVVFMGNIYSRLVKNYAAAHSERVALLPPHSEKTAKTCMKEADVLLNIGNTFRLQVPSKLIDYISSGKPIVSTCKMRQCPSLPYMEKYPLGLTLFEDEAPKAAAEKLAAFCRGAKGEQIPFSEIGALYRESTPGYVARQMWDALHAK